MGFPGGLQGMLLPSPSPGFTEMAAFREAEDLLTGIFLCISTLQCNCSGI
jgi:hypothetical protein